MGKLEIDHEEYATDGAAQAAYISDSSANLQVYSEATIKTQGNYSLRVEADTSSSGKILTHILSPASDLTGVNNLKFDIRSNRTGSNVKLGLYSGATPTGGTVTTDGYDTETGLTHHYKMNDNTSTYDVVDSVGSFNGTSSSTTDLLTTTGKINTALSLQADIISMLGLQMPINSGSIAFWLNPTSIQDTPVLRIMQNSPLQLFDIGAYSGTWYVGWLNNGADEYRCQITPANTGLTEGVWNYVVVTWDTTTSKISMFVNNIEVTYSYQATNFSGGWDTTTADSFVWNTVNVLDDIRIYNRVLTLADMTVLYAGTEDSVNQPTTHNIHTFTSDGTFVTPTSLDAEVLVVAGGGSGGAGYGGGGGGGAGGVLYQASRSITDGTYQIEIGLGGIANSSSKGNNGGNSTFNGLTAIGGGGGGYDSGNPSSGNDGGSGGGGNVGGSGGNGTQGDVDGATGYGNVGSAGVNYGGGAGGGAGGAAAENADASTGATGGTGYTFYGNTYAGGGGGGYSGVGTDGGGTGGASGGNVGENANTYGSGGGGGGDNFVAGGNGYQGVVIIKYPITSEVLVTEITPNVVVADQFQTVNWNIKSIADVDKATVSSLKVEITDASSANTLYLDNIEIATCIDQIGIVD